MVKFEDLPTDKVFVSQPYVVTRDEILDFARRYDCQPLHVDQEGARQGPFGDIIASGFMTLAVAWQLWLDLGFQGPDGRGGIAMDNVRWPHPLMPDATVRASVRITEHRVTSKGYGLVTWHIELHDEEGRELVRFDTTGLLHRIDENPG
jgi:acyl dehydratase